MTDQNKPKSNFTDTLANLVSDIANDVNMEVVQKAWFDNPLSHDGRLSDYYQAPVAPSQEPDASSLESSKDQTTQQDIDR